MSANTNTAKLSLSNGYLPAPRALQEKKTKGFGSGHSGDNDNYEVFHCFEVAQQSLTEMIYRQLLKVIRRTIHGLPDSFCTHATDE